MSDFQTHLQDVNDPYGTQPQAELQSTSGLAIGSLICSLIICCPLVTIFGPILGVIALVTIGSPPRKKGKGMAIAGIILGVISTIGSSYAWYWGIQRALFLPFGPDQAISSGFAGDITSFKTSFRTGARISDDDAQAFLDELEQRYGTFAMVFPPDDFKPVEGSAPGRLVAPMIADFSQRNVDAEVEINFMDMTIEYIIFYDSDLGDLRFPPVQ